jgi:hypothetical protein
MDRKELQQAEFILQQKRLNYQIQPVGDQKVNIYFGNPACMEVIRSFGKKSLSEYTAEEDFILGIMLGYDRNQQCERYMKRKQMNTFLINEK